MRRMLSAIAAVFFCASSVQSQTPTADKRLMTDDDFKAFLTQVEAALPKWEKEFKNINVEKIPKISYSQGKSIMDSRTLGLAEIDYMRLYLRKLQVKRSVSGELAFSGFMQSFFNIEEEILWEEDFGGLTLTHLENDAPQLSALAIRITNDVNARVALLEKGSCPP